MDLACSHRPSKGSLVINEQFWIVAIILMMLFLLAIWLLLDQSFVNYVSNNVVSDVTICNTFENMPVLGSISGCN